MAPIAFILSDGRAISQSVCMFPIWDLNKYTNERTKNAENMISQLEKSNMEEITGNADYPSDLQLKLYGKYCHGDALAK